MRRQVSGSRKRMNEKTDSQTINVPNLNATNSSDANLIKGFSTKSDEQVRQRFRGTSKITPFGAGCYDSEIKS
jgi:hypothetical protein